MTLLLIDDDQLLRSQVRFAVEELFEEVIEVSSKSETFDVLDDKLFDIALIDMHLELPYDGKEIAQQTIQRDIKSIMFTANKDQETIKELIQMGVFDYLQKPLDMNSLISSINRAILFRQNEQKLADDNIFSIGGFVDATEGIKSSLSDVEKELLIKILYQNDFNIYQTAKILNTKRENIYYFIKKYKIQRE